jgi:DNA-binding winged helix-turn-helix (wHTH) protein
VDEKTKKASFYVWDDIVVDAHRAVVMRGGERLTITAKVVDLLLILLERRGHIVEKAELMELLWPTVLSKRPTSLRTLPCYDARSVIIQRPQS